jgi:hypothetical protein
LNRIGDAERSTLAILADLLIPPVGEMPSASAIDVAGTLLDVVLNSRPDLEGRLAELLTVVAHESPERAVLTLQQDPERWELLTMVVAGSYFLHPRVRTLIGYPGQIAIPINQTSSLEPHELELLNVVRGRGSICRLASG